MNQEEEKQPNKKTIQMLYVINRLSYKAFQAESQKALTFIILNDTVNLVRYDRAILWSFESKKPELIGVSAQPDFDKKSELAQKWTKLMNLIEDPEKPQILKGWHFGREEKIWLEVQGKSNTTILWLPIKVEGKLTLGLWLELWYYLPDEPPSQEENLNLLNNFLMPPFGLVWERLKPKFGFKRLFNITGKQWYYLGLTLILLLFVVRVPLRIVAPCEVIPKDPLVIAAPLDGIIEEVVVDPGQRVKEGDILFEYDKNVPLQELKVSQKQVEIANAELNRAINLGHENPEARQEISILKLKLEKDKQSLDLAEYQASKLSVKAPENGIVILDNPDEWRGKPVQIGETVLKVTDPKNTKIKIWIPENDNIWINPKKSIKIILNVNPAKSEDATLIYIANAATISDQNIPSFIAEANWVQQPEDIKLGLKGTAVLYGERVTLFYFLFRKPWYFVRNFLGV